MVLIMRDKRLPQSARGRKQLYLKDKFICHLVPEHDFMAHFNNMITSSFDQGEHIFIVYDNRAWDPSKIYNMKNCYYINTFEDEQLMDLLERCSQIVVHYLYTKELTDFLFRNGHLLGKTNWLIWGADLYLYRYVGSPDNPIENEAKRTSIIRRLGYITVSFKEEYDLAKQIYGGGAQHRFGFYPQPIDFHRYPPARKGRGGKARNILVGNSGYPTNNHKEAFSILSRFRNEDVRIYCPLSYGIQEYIQEVCALGSEIFGRKFIPLRKFIRPERYLHLLNAMDLIVMNHDRQQAVGNIISSLFLQKKVYMRPQITTYRSLSRLGIKLYDISELADVGFEDIFAFPEEAGLENSNIIEATYSHKNCVESWKLVFMEAFAQEAPLQRPREVADKMRSEAYTFMAKHAMSEGRVNDAEALLTEALSHDPESPEALHQLALLRHLHGETKQALEILERATKICPDNAEMTNDLGTLCYFTGDPEKALSLFSKAVELDHTLLDARKNLAELFEKKGRFEEAEKQYLEILKIDPCDAESVGGIKRVKSALCSIEERSFSPFNDQGNPVSSGCLGTFPEKDQTPPPPRTYPKDELKNPHIIRLRKALHDKGWGHKEDTYAPLFEYVLNLKEVNDPALSIVVISWRFHPDNLKSFMILDKQRDKNFELIFVDNGGRPGEFECLKPYIDTLIRLNTNTGAYLARNVGAAFAKAPILLFLEDDGIPEANLVEAHLSLFDEYDIIACRGVYIPKTDNPLNKMQGHYYISDKEYPTFAHVEGNTSYRADTFFKAGGWDDEIMFGGGGLELYFRLLQVDPDKRKQIYSPRPIIYHDYATDEKHLKNKLEKQKLSFERLRAKYPEWDEVHRNFKKDCDRDDLLIRKKKPTCSPTQDGRSTTQTPKRKIERVLFVNHNLYPFERSGTPLSTYHHARGAYKHGVEVAVLFPSTDISIGYRKERARDGFWMYQVPALDKLEAYLTGHDPSAFTSYLDAIDRIINDFQPQIVQINDYVFMPASIIEVFSRHGCSVIREVCNMEEFCHRDYPVIPSGRNGRLCSGPDSPDKCARCLMDSRDETQTEKARRSVLECITRRFAYIKKLYRDHVDRVIFTSEPFRNYFTGFVSIPHSKVRIVPRGFDFSFSRGSAKKKDTSDVINIGFVGNVMFSKGIDVALNAFEKLHAIPGYTFHVFGEIVDSQYRDWIGHLQSRYPGKFMYHGAFRQEDIPKIASFIDVGVIPSYFDTYNRVLRELLYLGVPVISTDFFGAYIVENDKNGYRIPIGDAGALTDRIVHLITNPSRINHLSLGALETHIPCLDEEIESLMAIYKDILESRSHDAPHRAEKTEDRSMGNKGPTKTDTKLIAFYLPQFHPIPENDVWWGKGFTEWTNVTKARPLFPGHYQPHLPADLGYYDLRVPEVRKAQAELAKEYGIYGFCYYHYWFNGKLLLERPLEEVLRTGEPDFPFCICWANENWTRRWDGGDDQILMKQIYSDEDDLEHIRYLCTFFKDPRYIRTNGKPLFLVYRANLLPDPKRSTEIWREEAYRQGVGEIFLCRVESFPDEHGDPRELGFDAAVEFQPDWGKLTADIKDMRAPEEINAYQYEKVVDVMLQKEPREYTLFPCITPNWDNSPRRGRHGVVFTGSKPALYERWLRKTLMKHTCSKKHEDSLIFINAWNEWGEGNHLEPDQRYGRAYLHATKRALEIDEDDAERARELTEKSIDCIEAGRLAEAEVLLRDALERDPESPFSLHRYAVLLFHQQKIDEAAQALEKALAVDPSNAEFHNDMATILHALGDTHRAEGHFHKARELEPDNVTVLKNMTEFFLDIGRDKDALHVCEQLKLLCPDDKETETLVKTIHEKAPGESRSIGDRNNTPPTEEEQKISSFHAPKRGTARGIICTQPFHMMEFTTSGYVFMCCPAWTKLSIGNITKSTIAELWNSPQARLIRRKILSGRFEEVCNNACPYVSEYRHSGRLISWEELERLSELTPEAVDAIRAGRDYLEYPPTTFNLSNSTVCNLSCIMCSRHTDRSDPEIIRKTAMELEHYLASAKKLILSGMGDPFARPDTRELMIKCAKGELVGRNNLTIDLITNGLLLPKYWNDVKGCTFGSLLVSIDAADKETYEKIRRGGAWEDLLASLDLIKTHRDRFTSITLNMTVMRANYQSIPDFINFAESYGFGASFQKIRGTYDDQNIFEANDREAIRELSHIVNEERGKKRSINVIWGDLLEHAEENHATSASPCVSKKGTISCSSDMGLGGLTREDHDQKKERNKRKNSEECRREAAILESGPLTAIISVGSRCNLRCQMCSRTINKVKGTDMPWSVFEKCFEFLPTLQMAKLIGAGEPFLNPDYFMMLEITKSFGLATETVSNGTLITDEIAERIVKSGLGSLCISLDGADPATYESIRRGARFDQVIEGIRRINHYKKLYRSTTPVLGFSTVAMRRNVEELPSVIELAKSLDLSWVTILFLTVYAPELIPESLYFHQEISDRMMLETKRRAEQLGICVNIPGLFNEIKPSGSPRRRKKCFEPWQMVLIETGGQVFPCCTYGISMGNLNEADFFEIWNNESYQDLRRRVNTDDPPEPCKHCSNSTVAHSVQDIKAHIRCEIPPEYMKQVEKLRFPTPSGNTCSIWRGNGPWENRGDESDGKTTNEGALLHEKAIERFNLGDIDESIALMKLAIDLEPDNSEFLNDLGAIYHAIALPAKAQECFENALRIDPENVTSLKNLIELLIEAQRLEDARELCSRLGTLAPDDEEYKAMNSLILRELEKVQRSASPSSQSRARRRIRSERRHDPVEGQPSRNSTEDTPNSIEKNKEQWSHYDWPQGGDEWSSAWGGTDNLWRRTILPRILRFIPTGHILEIAPGFGRCTQYLLCQCQKLSAVDITEKCIDACRERFKDHPNASFFLNNGMSLDMIDDESIDFAFSWDSLVHVEKDVMRSYLLELGSKLRPGGYGFLHHSNIGEYRNASSGKLSVKNRHWRAESMSAELFRQFCKEAGLRCVSQEIIPWGGTILNDCLSTFMKDPEGACEDPIIMVNRDFMEEAKGLISVPDMYSLPLPAAMKRSERYQIRRDCGNRLVPGLDCEKERSVGSIHPEKRPLLSIILAPEDGKKAYFCLRSIVEDLPYEIEAEIIVAASEQRRDITDYISTLTDARLKPIPISKAEATASSRMQEAADNASGRFLVFLDESVIAPRSFFSNLLEFLTNGTAPDAIVAKTISTGKTILEAGSTFPEKDGLASRGLGADFDDPAFNYTCEVDSGSAYAMVVSREAWEGIHGLHPELETLPAFLVDLGIRLVSQGYRVVYQPECVLVVTMSDHTTKGQGQDTPIDSQVIEERRPPSLPPHVSKALGNPLSKNILVLGVYIANIPNTVSDIVRIFKGSLHHKVRQEWVALNGSAPDNEVASVTVKHITGRIPKFQIINDLMSTKKISSYDYIILCDDDVVLPVNFVDDFIAMQSSFDFAIAQPARTLNSYIDHPIVERHIGVHARQTRFVEIGPVVSFHRSAFELVFPFDLTSPMGWGYENVWAHGAIVRNLRMGIIDAVCVDHSLRKPVVNYTWEQADRERRDYLNRHEHLPLEECFTVVTSYLVQEERV